MTVAFGVATHSHIAGHGWDDEILERSTCVFKHRGLVMYDGARSRPLFAEPLQL
jgi:hypothetical protein